MTQKVIFFTAGPNPTDAELTKIGKLLLASTPDYETLVVNGAAISGDEFGVRRPIPSDFAAGTIPTAYSGVTVLDPDAIPNEPLLSTQAIVANAQALTLDSSMGTVALAVSSFGITGAALSLAATKKAMTTADVITLDSSMGTVALTIAANAITHAILALASTKHALSNGDVITLDGGNGTATVTVAGNAITGAALALPATKVVVADGAALVVPVSGVYATTATVSVAGGVVTGITLS